MKIRTNAAARRGVLTVFLAVCWMMMSVICVNAEEKEEAKKGELYNLLMIGTDHRDDSWNGNSDVMIVATIDKENKKITMTSFMRDLYADIPGCGVHKLNYAYAVGGGEKLEETLEDNYQIEIDNYAVVDFETMAAIIDAIGGVEIEVSDAEVEVLNGYLTSMEAEEDYLSSGGTYMLNGNQAVAYMRIRYVGNNDYQRTQRQRDVLKAIFASAGDLGVGELGSIAKEVLLNVEHNIGVTQLWSLLGMLSDMTSYELAENRIPYDDLYHSENEMLVPDFEATIERLHETLGM